MIPPAITELGTTVVAAAQIFDCEDSGMLNKEVMRKIQTLTVARAAEVGMPSRPAVRGMHTAYRVSHGSSAGTINIYAIGGVCVHAGGASPRSYCLHGTTVWALSVKNSTLTPVAEKKCSSSAPNTELADWCMAQKLKTSDFFFFVFWRPR